FLDQTLPGLAAAAHSHGINWLVAAISTVVAGLGVALAWVMYFQPSPLPGRIAAAFGPLATASQNRFYLDEVYQSLVVRPLRGLAQLSRMTDWLLVDGAFIGGLAGLPGLLGRLPRPIQNGLVQFYALATLLATAVLLWALLSKQT
ncbi:MAG: hypothetical protein ACKO3P_09265, partial [Planctomycetaceae bacterium]